mmetsp:Transcript_28727/g.75201  ORF Transcript_28727/g.75201 Transcript_28727/m.75201 type:complete len:415 (+) Transcript_28727:34-1278(+)
MAMWAMAVSPAQPLKRPAPLGTSARLAAALAVARRRRPVAWAAVVLYRALELCASAVLPAGVCWIIDPCAMLPIFILLWYLPAAGRAGSATKPVALPLLCFAVGDVSLLGLRPAARTARAMCTICIFRVAVLVALIPLCSRWSPLPEDVQRSIINWKALEALEELSSDSGTSHLAWVLLYSAAATLMLSMVWAAATLALILGGALTPRGEPRHPSCAEEIRQLADAVDQASRLDSPEACREELTRLRELNPGLVITSIFNTVGPAWAVFLHFAIDAGNVASLAIQGRWTLAVPLAFSVANSACYLRCKMEGPHRLPLEVVRSLHRGLATAEYMEAIRGDKAVLRIPETVLKVYSLIFAASGGTISVALGIGAVVSNVFLVARFVSCELDLDIQGVEDADLAIWGAPGKQKPKWW